LVGECGCCSGEEVKGYDLIAEKLIGV
jgi:hypothetical protein